MFEQSLIKTEFLGRDGFIWWIGQVADPKKSGWASVQPTDDKKWTGYYNRVKVRILGYHTNNCADLPDEDLPWAHILINPQVGSGFGGLGATHKYRGGEWVIGFFLDGEDSQQPIIMGSLFRQGDTADSISLTGPSSTKCPAFKTWTAAGVGPDAHNTQVATSKPGPGGIVGAASTSTGNKKPLVNPRDTQANTAKQTQSNVAVDNKKAACDTNVIGGITKFLGEFAGRIFQIQSFINVYVNPTLGALSDITSLVRETGSLIYGLITISLNFVRDWIMSELAKLLGQNIQKLLPKPQQGTFSKGFQGILEVIYCLFENIIKKFFYIIIDFLLQLVGKFINPLFCAAEQFASTLLNRLVSEITEAIQPILEKVTSLVGGVIGTAQDILNKAFAAANLLISLISCEDKKCPPPRNWSAKYGVREGEAQKYQKILKNVIPTGFSQNILSGYQKYLSKTGIFGVKSSDFATNAGEFAATLDSLKECPSDVLRCGPPKIEIFGGGGFGAAATAVVNKLGQVIGVTNIFGGAGYTSEPFVTVIDSCGKGNGARAKAIVDPQTQKVVSIQIIKPGEGYPYYTDEIRYAVDPLEQQQNDTVPQNRAFYESVPQPEPRTSPDALSEVINEVIGKEKSKDCYVIGRLSSVIVEFTGQFYSELDTITVSNGAELKPVLDTYGRIVRVDVIKPGLGFTEVPDLEINTSTGIGAVLIPVLEFRNTCEGDIILGDGIINKNKLGQVIKIVDCVGR